MIDWAGGGVCMAEYGAFDGWVAGSTASLFFLGWDWLVCSRHEYECVLVLFDNHGGVEGHSQVGTLSGFSDSGNAIVQG
jgi:hypothetical protein